MCKNYIWKSEIKNSVNYVVSLLFIGIEIQLQEYSMQIIQFLSLALIFVAIIYRILSVLQNNTLKTDLSPMFLWLLTLARIVSAKGFDDKSQLLICYILGFLNGQFNNSLSMSENSTLNRSKVGVQIIVIVVLLIIDNNEQISIIILQIALSILIGLNELRLKEESIITPKQDSLQKSQKLLNDPTFQKSIKNNSKNSNDENQFAKHSRQQALDSVEEYDQVPDSSDREPPLQNEPQNLNWSCLVEQCEDFLCRFTVNAHLSSESQLQHSYNNYTFNKFLQDNQMSFLHFIKEMKVYNDLNMIHYDLTSSEFQKLQSLYDWLHYHLEQYKLVEQIQIRKSLRSLKSLKSLHSDQLQLSNPSNQKSLFMDLIVEKSIMGISSIPYQQGSSSDQTMKNNKINLFGRIKGIKFTYDLNIKLYLFHEECESGSQLNIIFMMRDIDILVGSLKQNLKNVEILNSATKFIKNQVCKISGMHRIIKDAKHLFNESDYASTRTGTQVQRRTYSLGQSNKDSVEEVKSDISERFGSKKQNQLHHFIQKLQYDFIQVEQDNFNFFEVFTAIDKIWFEKKKIDLSQLINNIFELFQNDILITKYEIKLILIDQNLYDKCIITDTRRLKQLLINLINNAIKAYDYEQYQLAPNTIELSVSNNYEDINFQLVDYGCGIIQSDLNSARLQDGKLGLAACQRLVYQLTNCKKYLTIKRTEQCTSVQFSLPRVLIPEKIQLANEFQYENIQLINS